MVWVEFLASILRCVIDGGVLENRCLEDSSIFPARCITIIELLRDFLSKQTERIQIRLRRPFSNAAVPPGHEFEIPSSVTKQLQLDLKPDSEEQTQRDSFETMILGDSNPPGGSAAVGALESV